MITDFGGSMIRFLKRKKGLRADLALLGLILIFIIGCGRPPAKVGSDTPSFPEDRFLTAQGSGRTDMDARQQALAQLSSIFEAQVSSQFSSRTQSLLTQEQAEEFKTEMAARVDVDSKVHLQGARIGRSWQDESSGSFYALAVLDRMDAAENWAARLSILDAGIEGAQVSRQSATGPLSQLAALNRIVSLSGERQILESRLSVVDYPVASLSELTVDLGGVMAERATLIAGLRVFVSVAGEYGQRVSDLLVQALTGKGIALSQDPSQANVRILGDIQITDLNIGHPSARFARAYGNALVFETRPQTLFIQINDKVRKGNSDINEARRMAADALGSRLAERLVQSLGY